MMNEIDETAGRDSPVQFRVWDDMLAFNAIERAADLLDRFGGTNEQDQLLLKDLTRSALLRFVGADQPAPAGELSGQDQLLLKCHADLARSALLPFAAAAQTAPADSSQPPAPLPAMEMLALLKETAELFEQLGGVDEREQQLLKNLAWNNAFRAVGGWAVQQSVDPDDEPPKQSVDPDDEPLKQTQLADEAPLPASEMLDQIGQAYVLFERLGGLGRQEQLLLKGRIQAILRNPPQPAAAHPQVQQAYALFERLGCLDGRKQVMFKELVQGALARAFKPRCLA